MRKSKPKKRIILPDPKFNDILVTQFVNNLMFDGKKSLAYGLFYDAMDRMAEKAEKEGKSPLEIFKKALENASSKSNCPLFFFIKAILRYLILEFVLG